MAPATCSCRDAGYSTRPAIYRRARVRTNTATCASRGSTSAEHFLDHFPVPKGFRAGEEAFRPAFPSFGDEILRAAGAANEDFLAVRAGHGFQRRSRLVLNPAMGTLEIRPDLRAEIEKARSRKLRVLDLGVYLGDALVDRSKLRFQHRHALLEALDGVRGLVQKNSVDIHRYRRPGLACPASLGFALGASEDTTNKVGLAMSELNSALRM